MNALEDVRFVSANLHFLIENQINF
jgi:hypothetical protein